MTRQLSFDLPHAVASGDIAYFVSPANAQAHELVSAPARWPDGKLVIAGPAGAGKSHLMRVWLARSGGWLLRARDLGRDLDLPPDGAQIGIEDMEHLPLAAETPLFHLHNHLAATGGRLLMTADRAPAQWPIRLPDLASRMQAATVVQVADPDDALLAAVLLKHFSDRQIAPPGDLIPYAIARMERSFAAAARLVAALDRDSLALARPINRALVRDVLAAQGSSGA